MNKYISKKYIITFLLLFIVLGSIIYYLFNKTKEIYTNLLYNTNIYYINLQDREDRKQNLLKQLNKISIPSENIHRVDAIRYTPGSTGCGLSHIKALKNGLQEKNNNDFIIVLEDDFIWKYDSQTTINTLQNALKFKDWNVILLSCNGHSKPFTTFLNKTEDCQTASGYIIKKTYIPVLLKIWEHDMDIKQKYNINKDHSYGKFTEHNTAIDQSWKQLQNDKWYTVNPVLGIQIESYSDIENKVVNYKV